MSSAVLEPVVEQPKPLTIVAPSIPAAEAEKAITDHPLVPVVVAMVLAAIGAVAFVGSIVFWLAVRNSGAVAP